jgi:imidazolonepropionase-like amidohydrolase
MKLIFRRARVLDAFHKEDDTLYTVIVEDGVIREVSSKDPVSTGDAQVIDLNGRFLMPGMIDCHTHVIASMANLGVNARMPNVMATLRAVPILQAILNRGFTTVRDAGGADYALSRAVKEGYIQGPRLFVAGKALSQTGGHGDFRDRYDNTDPDFCPCSRNLGAIARVVDGVDDIRKAVREEMRNGASQIKIMASGGVASPTDPIGNFQYSLDEIRAVVEEARSHQTYVMAHAYTGDAIKRVVELGVRTIEHGNLVNDEAAALMAERGAFGVPTLVTYDALHKVGAQYGLGAESAAKIDDVRLQGITSLEIFKRNNVKLGLGSDLLGEMHEFQSEELRIRTQVYDPFDVICQATLIGAEIVNMQGKLGVIAEGAIADLLVLGGDPLKDIGVLCGQGEGIDMIFKEGRQVERA